MSSPIKKKKKKKHQSVFDFGGGCDGSGGGVSVAPSRVYLKYYTLLGYENFSMNQYLLRK